MTRWNYTELRARWLSQRFSGMISSFITRYQITTDGSSESLSFRHARCRNATATTEQARAIQNGDVGPAEFHSTFTILASISTVLSLTVISWDRVYAEIQWRVALP